MITRIKFIWIYTDFDVRCPKLSLQWRHNERDGVSNHQPRDCLLNRLFKAQIKESIKDPRH